MRFAFTFLFAVLLAAAGGRSATIRFDQISSDTTGYAHFDIERLLSSQVLRKAPDGSQVYQQIKGLCGEHGDVTFYSLKSGGAGSFVLLVHTRDPDISRRMQTAIAGRDDAIAIRYGEQRIHYTAANIGLILTGPPKDNAPPPHSYKPESKLRGSFSLGLGDENGGKEFLEGPTYAAFVGDDLVVVAGSLPAMVVALDVVQGTKPSLAKKDPQGLRFEPPAGTFFIGAGMSAQFQKENHPDNPDRADRDTPALQPARNELGAGGLNFDLIGSFRGKARLARVIMGETGENVFVDASFAMNDADSAGQLKNLIVGVKSFVGLAQSDVRPLIDPLNIEARETKVELHWSWPTGRLNDLFRLLEVENHNAGSGPAKTPATQPTH